MLSLSKKIKYLIYMFTACVLILALLVCNTFVSNREEAEKVYNSKITTETFNRLTVKTADGVTLFENRQFNESATTREANFHILGNTNDGIANSVIATQRPLTIVKDKEKHKYFEEREVTLTIDSTLQENAYNALRNQKYSNSGCIIVLDYTTGEIKALTSTPTIDVQNTEYIENGAYLNKALCTFVPGSVYKAVSVAATLEKNPTARNNFTYECTTKSGHISCSYSHGKVDLSKALEKSCNCAISDFISKNIKADELETFVEKMHLNDIQQIIDMEGQYEGNIDAEDDIKWTANGQAKTLTSPIAIAKFYGMLANEGKMAEPHIMMDTKAEVTRVMSPYNTTFITSALQGVTDKALHCKGFGKTGTAQVSNGVSHSWFVCSLTDAKAPPYTILVFLEKGGTSLNAKKVSIDFVNQYIL